MLVERVAIIRQRSGESVSREGCRVASYSFAEEYYSTGFLTGRRVIASDESKRVLGGAMAAARILLKVALSREGGCPLL
jgi:hypothetical protein